MLDLSLASLLKREHTDYAELALKELPEERERLRATVLPVVLFVALSSTVVHVS